MTTIIRVLDAVEAREMHKLHTTPTTPGANYGDYIYYMEYALVDDLVYHYILVDDTSYRITYKDLGNDVLKFTGEVVELSDDSQHFIDDEDY